MSAAYRRLVEISAAGAVRRMDASGAIDDAALVARAIDGDRWAEEALYRRHVRRVTDLAVRILRRSSDAEDAVQDAFVTALSRLSTLREPALFERWLLRIAMNEVRGRLRKRKLLRAIGLDRGADDATLESLASPGAPSDVRAQLSAIDVALSAAGAGERMAWMLRVLEGLTLPETADALGCSLATVKRRIAAAQARLDACFADRPIEKLVEVEP